MRKEYIFVISAILGLSSCSTVRPPVNSTSLAAPAASSRTPTRTELDLARERLAQVSVEDRQSALDWNAALVVTAGGTPMLTVPRADGTWLVVGLDPRHAVVAGGRVTTTPDGTTTAQIRNFSAGTERSTRITAQGTLVSESVTGRAPRLKALYTCAELRDRVNDARNVADDAKAQMAIAVAGAAISPVGGPTAVAIATATVAYMAYRVMQTDSQYREVASRYHASCQ